MIAYEKTTPDREVFWYLIQFVPSSISTYILQSCKLCIKNYNLWSLSLSLDVGFSRLWKDVEKSAATCEISRLG